MCIRDSLNGGIFDFCLCVLDNDIVCLFSLNNLCIAVFVCTVCTCRGNNRNAPVSYTHLDVYKRQAIDGALKMEQTAKQKEDA